MMTQAIDVLRAALEALREALGQNRGIRFGLWWTAALLAMGVVAMPFDHRIILGISPWIKPMKFELSILIFLTTVAIMLWALGREGRWRRSRAVTDWGFAVCMVVEITIIALQSARGVRSHMNYSTAGNALLFAVMGQFIALNTLLAAWLLVLWCVTKTNYERAVVWGVRLGLLVLLLASAEGVRIVAHGAHTVGAADGGAGLPFINWSTGHGDLRVAHFFALHALQIFPLVGLLLSRFAWPKRAQVAAVFGFALVYTAAVWWLFVQAMKGLPLLRV